MSEHPVTPERDDGDWRRWQMDELGVPERARRQRERSRQEAIRQQVLQRNAELEALRETARKEAYDAGYQAGFDQGQQEGYEQGISEGRTAGEQQLHRETQQTLEPLAPLAAHFREALDSLDNDLAERLVDLALTTGRQLAGDALQAHPEEILDIVRELIHVEPALSGRPRLWLHPADLTIVKAHLSAEFEAAGWLLQPDDLISRGGCRATSASGELDATLETRWEAITSQVRRRHNDETPKGDTP